MVTVPNVLSLLRLAGTPVLIIVAALGLSEWSLGLAITLLVLDWLDGRLARWFHWETPLGARLDSIADATFYAGLLVAVVLLKGEVIREEWIWITVAVGSYVVNVAASLLRFHAFPSYHTRMAKTSWFLMVIAVLALFADWSVWPLRLAMIAVVLTNVEATALTWILPERRSNVLSIFHVDKSEDKNLAPSRQDAEKHNE